MKVKDIESRAINDWETVTIFYYTSLDIDWKRDYYTYYI